jgi:peroxiredoxin family protein/TusA-related sulfurtransferase/rhodanese-related sulfurtransferase
MLDQVMAILDFEMAALLHRHLREKGIRLALGDGLKEIAASDPGRLRVTLASGKSVTAEMVLLAIGVRPENELAKAAGLELGPQGHVVTNAHMQTSDPHIYAVGDVTQVVDPILNTKTAIPLAGPANRQARIAADHIMGRDSAYQGTQGTAIAKVFDLAAASVGASTKSLQRANVPFLSSITHSNDHVAYYPDAALQAIKLFCAPDDGRLLGAQVVGANAVDRTIDVLATAIKAKMSVYDLEHLEMAYAPPYGAARDAVNIAGMVAANRLRGDTTMIEWRELATLDPAQYGLLDVRTIPEWDLGHIPGALHIPNDQLRARLGELDPAKTWVVYCEIGRRAYIMERLLRQRGFRAANLSGGCRTHEIATEKQDNFDTWKPQAAPLAAAALPPARTGSAPAPAALALNVPPVPVDARGMQCPGPILAVYKKMQEVPEGATVEVLATDPGFRRDIGAWCERTGNALLEVRDEGKTIIARVCKGSGTPQTTVGPSGALPMAKNMVVFSGDLDHALAAFIIANGAAAMGQKVTMFFTFWGLNILRRRDPQPVHKNLVERMFGWMMPRGAEALKLSNLNMAGMGTAMMKGIMKAKNVDSLPSLIRSAQENGVRLIACQMTMDLMGIKNEELVDGVELGGVATFIANADQSNATLFI